MGVNRLSGTCGALLWIAGCAASGAMDVHASPHQRDGAVEFAAACLGTLDPAEASTMRVRTFGSSPESSRRLIDHIATGDKSGTFTSPWLYEREPERAPIPGGLVVITDYDGLPVLLVRTAELTYLTFATVTEEHTALDGPGARPLDAWRRIHWDFFTRTLAPHGLAPEADMPVVLERFELLCDRGWRE